MPPLPGEWLAPRPLPTGSLQILPDSPCPILGMQLRQKVDSVSHARALFPVDRAKPGLRDPNSRSVTAASC